MRNRVVTLASRIIMGGLPLTGIAAYAQTVPQPPQQTVPQPPQQTDTTRQNEEVLRKFNQEAGTTAALAPSPDGETRIDFHGSVRVDVYNNSVRTPDSQSGTGQTFSGVQQGTFFKSVSQGDLRATSTQGGVTYAQGTVTNTSDRAVLQRYNNQLTNFQIGRTGEDYQWAAGDVAVSYSQLSSNLGMRGLYASKRMGSAVISGNAGVIAESWEALANTATLDGNPARTRYTRDVFGGKVENAFTPGFKVYVTAQNYNDEEGSVPIGSLSLVPARARAITSGFAYQEGQFTLNGEAALSRFQEKDQDERRGHAAILDGTYRIDTVGFNAGYHQTSTSYASLSQAIQPGITEHYAGVNWAAASWLNLSSEIRDSRLETASYTVKYPASAENFLEPYIVVGTTMRTKSHTNRANINFGVNYPGLGIAVQHSMVDVTDNQGITNPSTNLLTTFSYSTQTWNSNTSIGVAKTTNTANPQYDSKTETWQFQLGRQFTNGTPETPATWNANASFNVGQQKQNLINLGLETKTTNAGINFTMQQPGALQFSSNITGSMTSQPTGGPSIKTRTIQVEGTYPFGQAVQPGYPRPGALKAYVRDTVRNMGDAALEVRESTVGVQVAYTW